MFPFVISIISSKRGILFPPSFVLHSCNSDQDKIQISSNLVTALFFEVSLQSYISSPKSWNIATCLSFVNQASISIDSIPLLIASKMASFVL